MTSKNILEDVKTALSDEKESEVPLPTAAEVLYVLPLPSEDRKNCQNCALFVKSGSCNIHKPQIQVSPESICGYWVGGEPTEKRWETKVDYVEPEYSGLEHIKGGTSCSNCHWFEPKDRGEGKCRAVLDPKSKKHLHVLGKSCCSRWQNRA
jgi:hypothetical protein